MSAKCLNYGPVTAREKTLDELMANMGEVIELCLEEQGEALQGLGKE